MKIPTNEEVLQEMLVEALKELFSIKISRRIKEKLVLRMITPATEKLRERMEREIAEYDSLIESQQRGVEVIKEFIEDEHKKGPTPIG